jgi:uncharacterized membrane protein YecN with MAPEG domain
MPVSVLLGGAFALMMVPLSVLVSLKRYELKVVRGDGGDKVLSARIRAHGNFIEYAPLSLMVLALVEIADGPPRLVWALGAIFLFSRVLHALGMLVLYRSPVARGIAMITQHAGFVIAGGWLLTHWRL